MTFLLLLVLSLPHLLIFLLLIPAYSASLEIFYLAWEHALLSTHNFSPRIWQTTEKQDVWDQHKEDHVWPDSCRRQSQRRSGVFSSSYPHYYLWHSSCKSFDNFFASHWRITYNIFSSFRSSQSLSYLWLSSPIPTPHRLCPVHCHDWYGERAHHSQLPCRQGNLRITLLDDVCILFFKVALFHASILTFILLQAISGVALNSLPVSPMMCQGIDGNPVSVRTTWLVVMKTETRTSLLKRS